MLLPYATKVNITEFFMVYTNRLILSLLADAVSLDSFLESSFVKPPFLCEAIYAFTRLNEHYSINIVVKPYEGEDADARMDTCDMQVIFTHIKSNHPEIKIPKLVAIDGKELPQSEEHEPLQVNKTFTILPNISHAEAVANECLLELDIFFKEVETRKANENNN